MGGNILRVVTSAFVVSFAAPALATTYYVAPDGSDSNSGTSLANAFATPQRGVNAARTPGDIVSILPGKPYGGGSGATPPIVLVASGSGAQTSPGGNCSKPITIEGYALSTQRPVINGVQGAAGAGALSGSGVSCVVIRGLELAGWNASLLWANAAGNATWPGAGWQNSLYTDYGLVISGNTTAATHHITITDLYVHDFPGGGIGVVYGDYISVLQNTVVNNAWYSPWQGSGISLYQNKNSDKSSTTHNVISDNFVASNVNLVPSRLIATYSQPALGSEAGQTFLSVASTNGVNYTQLVLDVPSGCIPPNTTVQYWGSTFIGLSNPTTCGIPSTDTIVTGYATDGEGIIIDNTSESQSGSAGIAYTARSLVINNITSNNGGAGIQCGPISAHCDISFNTSYLDQVGAGNIGNNYSPGAVNVSSSTDLNVYNNIFYIAPKVTALWDLSVSGANWGNNLVFGGMPGNFGHAIPGNNNIIGKDPMFVAPGADPQTANFHLQIGSPAIAAGSTLFNRRADFAGNAATAGAIPDLGAYVASCGSTCQ